MEIALLSHSISAATPLYGGKTVEFTAERCMNHGDTSNSLMLRLPNHASTHVDAPFHFVPTGKKITDYSAAEWVFRAVALVDVPAVGEGELIDSKRWDAINTAGQPDDAEFVLLRTGFEKRRGDEAYWARSPGLHSSLCAALRLRFPRLRAVGVDCISVSSLLNREEGRAAHREFLGAGILLVEDMKLSALRATPRALLVSPLLIEGGDGAPVTVFAFSGDGSLPAGGF